MFDKMIVSDADNSHDRGRSRYFLVTGLIVGTLFFSAVVLSIYAVDLDLGAESFELSMMAAPVPVDEPEPPRPEPQRSQPQQQRSDVPIRNANILRPEESPIVPDTISVEKPTSLFRPRGAVLIDPNAVETVGPGVPDGVGRPRGNGGPVGTTSSDDNAELAAVAPKLPEPPPVMKPKPVGPVSLGVVNGKATSLPKPPYPAAAIAVNAQGEVTVQVTIDEEGKVVSAKAVKGHPLLTREAERAALNARFSPTTLSKVPVKVTGIIIYNFKR